MMRFLEQFASASIASIASTASTASPFSAQAILDGLSDAVLVVDADSTLLYASRGWQALSGRESGDAREDTPTATRTDGPGTAAQRLRDALHPADQSRWDMLARHVSRRERPDCWRLRILGADHHYRWCEVRSQSLSLASPWPATLTLHDISERVQQEQIDAANLRSLTRLIKGLPAMVYRARNNRHWSMEYISDGCLAITGLSPQQLLDHPSLTYGEMIHPEDADRVWDQVQAALEARTPFTLAYRIRHRDGEVIRVQEKGHGIYSPDGTPLAVEGIIFAVDTSDIPGVPPSTES
ncbi:PAS domain-containing protein [Cobetia amphilecti]|uniref:PAS domain-containing protein n=1 Tax=Cobetia amphilecti TaxID=1055104 RepID=UPI001C086E82|nr:PAS domain-containing protein [Cobetia amphilecti]MBU3008653.1 PAS domain-containing protein [Cobetia amphilecti]